MLRPLPRSTLFPYTTLFRSCTGAAVLAAGCTMGPREAPTPSEAAIPRVARIWRGRTSLERADEYQFYLYEAGVKKDRKSTRLNSSHSQISYAVFCLKKKKNK